MNQALYIYPIKTNKKTRLITTYRNNQVGIELRAKHQAILGTLPTEIFSQQLVYSYIPKQNIKQLVHQHLESNYFLTCDIRSFFNSIDHQLLLKLIEKYELTAKLDPKTINDLCLDNSQRGLGIGLLLSPYLSNLYLIEFDQHIFEYCQNNGIIYTRYADDLSFSAQDEFNYDELLAVIRHELKQLKLQLNTKKTHIDNIITEYSSIKLLGLNIVNGCDNHYITVSRNFKRHMHKQNNPEIKQGMENYILYNDSNYML